MIQILGLQPRISKSFSQSLELYDAVHSHDEDIVITHKGDQAWRTAVLNGTDSLLALRHVVDDGADEQRLLSITILYISAPSSTTCWRAKRLSAPLRMAVRQAGLPL